jgi:hypothetical protein
LQGGWKSQMTPITNKPNGPGFIEGKTKDLKVEAGSGPVHMVEGGTGFYARGYEKMKGLGRHDGPIFFGSNFLVIDAADAPNRGFSVTIAKTKTITAKALQRLRVGLGLKKPQPLHIVFLVPAGYSAPEVTLPSSTSTKWYFAAIPSPLANEEVWKEALQEPATMNPQKVLKPHKQQHVTHTSHTTTHTHTQTHTHTHTHTHNAGKRNDRAPQVQHPGSRVQSLSTENSRISRSALGAVLSSLSLARAWVPWRLPQGAHSLSHAGSILPHAVQHGAPPVAGVNG